MTKPTTGPDDEIRVVSWNIEHNGVDATGNDERWHMAMCVLADLAPHLVLQQELTGAGARGGGRLWEEANHLGGLFPFLASATPESPNPTGVFADPALFTPTEYFEHATGHWHAICNPVFRLKGAVKKLSVASFHLCSHDPDRRASEARRLITLGKPGMAAIIAGDCNSYAHHPSEAATLPRWAEITDRSHFECRTVPDAGGRVSDTRPDEILSGSHGGRPAVFVDLARHAATTLDQPEALTPTASLRRTDQGPRQRIDRIYATPQVADALIGLEVITSEDVVYASDHAPILARFSRSTLRKALSTDSALAAGHGGSADAA